MGKFRETTRPWELIYIDFVGPLPRSNSGFVYMLVIVDTFTKFDHIHPMRNATTIGTIKCLREHIFYVFGTPRFLVSDNGSQFTATAFKSFLEKHHVTTWYTSFYHPQANASEAANKTIETAIRSYLHDEKNHRTWDTRLPELACAINTSAHTSTSISPFFALFGLHMRTSGADYYDSTDAPTEVDHPQHMQQIRKLVNTHLHKAYNQNKKRYDLRA